MNAFTKSLALCSVLALGVLAAGCGGSGASAATFCADLKSPSFSGVFASVSSAPTSKTAISNAATTLHKLAGDAPSAVKSDVQTLATAFGDAANGDVTALNSSSFHQALNGLKAWYPSNCK